MTRDDSPAVPDAGVEPRIEVLSAELADQIAAGEVVERPASVVKELVENAIDAGARRVEIVLEGAGVRRIVVDDDGHGIQPDDLPLCVMRHATSKLKQPSQLLDVRTLGFRGEALASIAAVAVVSVQSRMAGAKVGTHLRCRPGLAPTVEPVGMSFGTRVAVEELFINVPARRKFLRAPATELGHSVDTLLKIGLVHPQVHLRLLHDQRKLLDLPAASLAERIAAVLERRGARPSLTLDRVHDDVAVRAWLAPPDASVRGRSGTWFVARRRVVSDRNVQRIVHVLYGDRVVQGRSPVACIWVEPPAGTVDVNVHPQKSEVRFSDAQRVYAAIRAVLAEAEDVWGRPATVPATSDAVDAKAEDGNRGATASTSGTITATTPTAAQRASVALESWAASPYTPKATANTYRLQTRAASPGYSRARDGLRAEAAQLKAQLGPLPGARPEPPSAKHHPDPPFAPARDPEPQRCERPFEWLTCLPGPVALIRRQDAVFALDLVRVRSHLVYRRLVDELGGRGRISSQMVLEPVVLRRRPDEVRAFREHHAWVERLGLCIEPFADDALRVRGVPATIQDCLEAPDIQDLIERITPWLRMQSEARDASVLERLARIRGPDPAPRLAKRWIKELLEQGTELADVPGIVRWDARSLCPDRTAKGQT